MSRKTQVRALVSLLVMLVSAAALAGGNANFTIGERSLKATYFLLYQGYNRVANMDGGINKWASKGFPIQGTRAASPDALATAGSCCGPVSTAAVTTGACCAPTPAASSCCSPASTQGPRVGSCCSAGEL